MYKWNNKNKNIFLNRLVDFLLMNLSQQAPLSPIIIDKNSKQPSRSPFHSRNNSNVSAGSDSKAVPNLSSFMHYEQQQQQSNDVESISSHDSSAEDGDDGGVMNNEEWIIGTLKKVQSIEHESKRVALLKKALLEERFARVKQREKVF